MASYAARTISIPPSQRRASRPITSCATYSLRRVTCRQSLTWNTFQRECRHRSSRRRILTWLHIVEDQYHVKPILYTYYKFKEKYLSDQRFDSYPYWIAHYYVDKMEYKGEWKFWQHTDAGRLSGIKGYVDFNLYNGSYYDLKQLCLTSENLD